MWKVAVSWNYWDDRSTGQTEQESISTYVLDVLSPLYLYVDFEGQSEV